MNRKLGIIWTFVLLLAALPLSGQEASEVPLSAPTEAEASQDVDALEPDADDAAGALTGRALSAAEQLYETPGVAPDSDPVIAEIRRAYQEAAAAESAGDDSATSSATTEDSFYRQSLQAVAVLCLICALVVLSGYLMRRFGKGSPLLAGPSLGHELGRIYLNPKASLHFVRSGGRVLVVGVTPQSMNLITEFDQDSFEEGERSKPAPAKIRPFESELHRSAARMENRAVDDEDFDALRGDIKRLQQYLQDSARENQ